MELAIPFMDAIHLDHDFVEDFHGRCGQRLCPL
jgi:hypothetical protein